jgi:hypothetical protein
MSRDGEPQDPWFEKFNAQRDAMDKKLADSYRQLEDHLLAMDKQSASINAKLNAMFDDIDAKLQKLLHQSHRSKSRSSRSSCSKHGGKHERHRHPHPQEHGANHQHHLDSLCERKKPIPCKDESHIHIENKSDTPHELSEDILLSNNLTSTPLVLYFSLLGCSDNDDVLSMEMRDSTICEMSESTICESEWFHFEGISDTPRETRVVVDRSSEAISISHNLPSTSNVSSHVSIGSMDEKTPTLDKMYMVYTHDDTTPCLQDDEHAGHMELPTSTTPISKECDYKGNNIGVDDAMIPLVDMNMLSYECFTNACNILPLRQPKC